MVGEASFHPDKKGGGNTMPTIREILIAERRSRRLAPTDTVIQVALYGTPGHYPEDLPGKLPFPYKMEGGRKGGGHYIEVPLDEPGVLVERNQRDRAIQVRREDLWIYIPLIGYSKWELYRRAPYHRFEERVVLVSTTGWSLPPRSEASIVSA